MYIYLEFMNMLNVKRITKTLLPSMQQILIYNNYTHIYRTMHTILNFNQTKYTTLMVYWDRLMYRFKSGRTSRWVLQY